MSSLSSGHRFFTPTIQSFTGVASVRWTRRFAWIQPSNGDPSIRFARSKLAGNPADLSAFALADALNKATR